MQSKKRNRFIHIILLIVCAGFVAVALSGSGIPYGHMNHGYGYDGTPRYNSKYSGWGPGPTRYHGPAGMNMNPDYWRDNRYNP
jgi:hypothetical protein